MTENTLLKQGILVQIVAFIALEFRVDGLIPLGMITALFTIATYYVWIEGKERRYQI